MACIKNSSNYQVGDRFLLKNDHESMSGKFETGAEVIVTEIGNRGYSISDEKGNSMIECGWDP